MEVWAGEISEATSNGTDRLRGQEPELRMELRKTRVSVIVFRRDAIMVMCPGADEGNDSVGWELFKEWHGALAQPRR